MRCLHVVVASLVIMSSALARDRPNVLLCVADDWGWPDAGVYGNGVVRTPAFDRVATEGVRFEMAFVSSPSCTPSRNSIITGQHFFRLGAGANLHGTLNVSHPNVMFLFRESGYEIGHWRKAWGPGDFRRGGYEEHPCGPGSTFEAFLEGRDGSRPFFFWFGTSDPHRPYRVGKAAEVGIEASEVVVPPIWPDTDSVRADIAEYAFEVSRWDADVGRALALLEEAGELDDTIVIVTGDHGMPFPRSKGTLYDSGARVPLAMRWPARIERGSVHGGPVSLVDLAPTLLEAAGEAIPGEMTGRSLWGPLSGEAAADASVILGRERHTTAQEAGLDGGYPSRAIRTGRHLLIRNDEPDRWPSGAPGTEPTFRPGAWFADCDNGPTKIGIVVNRAHDWAHGVAYDLAFAKRPAIELYDSVADPWQMHNLAGDPRYGALVEELSQRLHRSLSDLGDPRASDARVDLDRGPYSGGAPQRPSREVLEGARLGSSPDGSD